jgi:hypothetical protein
VQLAQPPAPGERPCERMLAAARSYDQHLHPFDPRGVRARTRSVSS